MSRRTRVGLDDNEIGNILRMIFVQYTALLAEGVSIYHIMVSII